MPEKARGISDSESQKSRLSGDHDASIELHRGLKARHITMIAIGGAIGMLHACESIRALFKSASR
jgi:amino acid permease